MNSFTWNPAGVHELTKTDPYHQPPLTVRIKAPLIYTVTSWEFTGELSIISRDLGHYTLNTPAINYPG